VNNLYNLDDIHKKLNDIENKFDDVKYELKDIKKEIIDQRNEEFLGQLLNSFGNLRNSRDLF
jgi:archaellum component FlaC